MARHNRSVGIDFGTSTSYFADRFGLAEAEIVPIGRTTAWMPSLAALGDHGLVVGEVAEGRPAANVIRSVKRTITRNQPTIDVAGRTVDADSVIEALLRAVVERADAAGATLAAGDVRLGCPAMWTGPQRERLRGLAVKAGIPVDEASIIDEPIAAGVSWLSHEYLSRGEHREGRLLVFDMGGGTLDIAVLDVVGGQRPEVSVLSAVGIDRAGDSLDERLADDVLDRYKRMGVDFDESGDPALARALVTRAMRRAKIQLSAENDATIRLDSPFGTTPGLKYSRLDLEDVFRPQVDEAVEYVFAALRQAKLTEVAHADPRGLRRLTRADLADDVQFVLLAGGMSRIPLVHDRLSELFPRVEVFHRPGVEPEEAIVAGLSDNTAYERINLHRPGFNFVLEWEGRIGVTERASLYEAHTPFYDFVDAVTKTDLSYRATLPARQLPPRGEGRLRAQALSGEWLDFSLDGDVCDGFAVPFGHHDIVLKMQTNGRIVVCDGRGEVIGARVEGWPVLRGRDHKPLVLRRDEAKSTTAPWPWYLDKEFPGLPARADRRSARW